MISSSRICDLCVRPCQGPVTSGLSLLGIGDSDMSLPRTCDSADLSRRLCDVILVRDLLEEMACPQYAFDTIMDWARYASDYNYDFAAGGRRKRASFVSLLLVTNQAKGLLI
jgi:hypothetical protein